MLVSDAEDLAHKGAYRLGRVHCLHPQIRQGKEIVRRATIAVLARSAAAGPEKINYILRDLSKLITSYGISSVKIGIVAVWSESFPFD